MLTLISERNIIIADNLKNGAEDGYNADRDNRDRHSIVVDAALCAIGGSFMMEHLNNENDEYQGPTPDDRGFIMLKGCVIERFAGQLYNQNHNGTGYKLRLEFDNRLRDFATISSNNRGFTEPRYERLDLEKDYYKIGETSIGTLILAAGCEIHVSENGFVVTDSLFINGTEDDPVVVLQGYDDAIQIGGAGRVYSRINGLNSSKGANWIFKEGSHSLVNSTFSGEMTFGGDVQIDSCTFSNRVKFLHADDVTVSRSLFDGGIAATIIDGAATFTNCTIVNSPRAGIETDMTEDVTLVNCIVAHNRWGVLSSGLHDPIIRYSDVTDNYVDDYVDCAPGEGCFSEDPRFVNARVKDYHLADNSLCIDSGDPASPRDPDGTRADIGAHYHPHPMTAPIVVSSFHGLSMAVAPNPFNDQTRLMIETVQAGDVEVALYDLSGRARLLSRKDVAAGGSSLSLDASGLPAGVYLARATAGGESVTVKVVKVE